MQALLLLVFTCLGEGGVRGSHEVLVAEGRAQYEMVTRESSRPKYGSCWTTALRELESGCKVLDDDIQSRLALNFANCFLGKAGQKTYPCDAATRISTCLEEVDSNAFNTYSNFFTHTQNMCYFLQAQVWQEDTEAVISSLASNSEKVASSLEESHELQRQLVEGQQRNIEYQRQLAENGSFLARSIEASRGSVRDMLEEFKESTFEQKTLIFEVFDRVSRLQNLVLSEVSWLYTVVFYGACLVVIYLVTATRRTAEARLWLFVLLTANLAVERLVVKWSLPQDAGEAEVFHLSQLVSDRVWLCRQVAVSLAMLLLAFVAYSFKDYNRINNVLLEEIKKQNLELRRSMESFQLEGRRQYTSSSSSDLTDSRPHSLTALEASQQTALTSHLAALLAEDTGFVGDEENFSGDDEEDDDDDDDLNSTNRTDRTYAPQGRSRSISRDVSFSEDDDDFNTAVNSRESTPVNEEIDAAMEALTSCLVTSTGGVRSGPSTPAKATNNLSSLITPLPATSCGGGGASKARTSKGAASEPPPRRYNLRRTPGRSGQTTPSASNSPTSHESPEAFSRVVKKQLQVTKRNTAKWTQALKKQEQAEFSSDEQ